MAEVYTVGVDNSTPVEITGGRVGQFLITGGSSIASLYIGGADLAVSYPGSVATVTNGWYTYFTREPTTLYVTLPDEVYAVLSNFNGGAPLTDTVKVFHNR